VNSTRSRKW